MTRLFSNYIAGLIAAATLASVDTGGAAGAAEHNCEVTETQYTFQSTMSPTSLTYDVWVRDGVIRVSTSFDGHVFEISHFFKLEGMDALVHSFEARKYVDFVFVGGCQLAIVDASTEHSTCVARHSSTSQSSTVLVKSDGTLVAEYYFEGNALAGVRGLFSEWIWLTDETPSLRLPPHAKCYAHAPSSS